MEPTNYRSKYMAERRASKKEPDLEKRTEGRVKGKSIYKELNDRDWLEQKYHTELLCTGQIGDIIGCSEESVRQALIRHEIEIRSKTEAFKLIAEDDGFQILNQEVFDGCMLGDGSIDLPESRKLPWFAKSNKFRAHLAYNGAFLFTKEFGHRIKYYRRKSSFKDEKHKDKYYEIHELTSLGHEFLIKEYERWYPEWNNYEKIVPKDITFSPALALNWFLDDGCSFIDPRPGGSNAIRVEFATNGFSESDVNFLRTKFAEIGIRTAIISSSKRHNRLADESLARPRVGDGFYLAISQRQINFFFDYIGPCPVPELEYKWKRPDPCRLPPLGALPYEKCFSNKERRDLEKAIEIDSSSK